MEKKIRPINKNSSIRLVELQATEFGKLDGSPTIDFYSFFKLPPRALPNLSAILESENFTDVKMMSPTFHGRKRRFTEENYNELNNSQAVLISSISRTAPPSMELADKIRSENPNAILIAGGMDASYRVPEWLEHVDIVVRGEGERTIAELMDRLTKDPSSLEDINGISYNKNGDIIETPDRKLMSAQEFENLPLPNYDEKIIKGTRSAVVEQERGCPHDCDFCVVAKTYRQTVRYSSIEKTIAELRRIEERDMGRDIFFTGDNMAGNPKKSLELTTAIIDAGLYQRPKVVQVSARLARFPKLMQGMMDAGINRLFVGFESIFDDSLLEMNKPFNADQNTEAAKTFREYGFGTTAMMMVTEKETPGRIRELVEWAKKYTDSLQLFIKTPLPGTPYAERIDQEGKILTKDLSLYDGQHCIIRPDTMSPYDMQMAVLDGYRNFYSVESTKNIMQKSTYKGNGQKFTSRELLSGIENLAGNAPMKKHLEFLKSESK